MQYYRIEFTIKDGIVTEKVLASGSNCTAVTKALEEAIGEVRSQELLPEYQNVIETETETEDKLWQS